MKLFIQLLFMTAIDVKTNIRFLLLNHATTDQICRQAILCFNAGICKGIIIGILNGVLITLLIGRI